MLHKTIIGLVVLFLVVFILRPFDPTGPLDKLLKNPHNPLSQSTDSISSSPVKLTHPIFNPDDIDFVSPLGESNGGYIEVQPLGGMTVNIKKEVAEKGPIEVYAPTDMQLVSYAHYIMDPEPNPDWALYFKIDDSTTLVLHHINNASPKIVDVVGNNPKKNDSRTIDLRWPKEIKFQAGDVIGTTTGTSQAKNWNIYFYVNNVKNQFINQQRYESAHMGQNLINAACIFDYFQDENIKNDFYALLGTSGPGETNNCGTSSKDVAGTLSGLWHLKQDGIDRGRYDGSYADPFSVYMRADKSIMIYEMARKTFTIYPNNPTYKPPEEITDDHCYRLTDDWNPNEYKGYAYFRIDSDTRMSVFYSPSGSCPATFPEGQTKTYYR